jgi:calcineurin-like phosphoesterase family protein
MDEWMVERWNARVQPQDMIWHLGDVYMGRRHPETLLRRLNGRKKLIIGNHDKPLDPVLAKTFDTITYWHRMDNIVMTHCPLHPSMLIGGLATNVHGHIHDRVIGDGRYINVSVEQIEYAPIELSELAKVGQGVIG